MLTPFFSLRYIEMTAPAVSNLSDERLIREGEAAVDGYNKDLRTARARIMPMARGLLAAKRKYPATQEFGDWLHTSSYREIGDTDRAALINIGKHEVFAEKFVRTTSLFSPGSIWDAIAELQPTSRLGNSTPITTNFPEPPVSAPVAGQIEELPPPKQTILAAPAPEPVIYDAPKKSKLQEDRSGSRRCAADAIQVSSNVYQLDGG